MTIRIANAPVSFGVFEMTTDRPDLPGGAELARVIAEAGYAGTELGPPSYFGEGAALAELLAEHGLALVGSFLPLRFAYRDSFSATRAKRFASAITAPNATTRR